MALLAGMGAACTSERFAASPLFTSSTGAQPTPAGGLLQQMPPAPVGSSYGTDGQLPAPPASAATPLSGAVTRADLPPAGQTQQGGTYQAASLPSSYIPSVAGNGSGYPADTYASAQPGAAATPAPATRQGSVITVASGETLYGIARRYGVSVSQLAAANGITIDTQLRIGQKLTIPGSGFAATASASPDGGPVVRQAAQATAGLGAPPQPLGQIHSNGQATAAPAPVAAGPVDYTVLSGDTLGAIARRHGVTVQAIVEANQLGSAGIYVGQRLHIPAAGGPAPDRAAVAAQAPRAAQPAGPQVASAGTGTRSLVDATPAPAAASAQPAPAASASSPADVQVASVDDTPSADGTTFRWPVRGRIISSFGTKPNGERNDGINLAVPEGTSVKAAEAGTVIYAGNEIAGYGNLVLVRHAGGWVTAYAHAEDILVKRGDAVRRGQIIARAGMTGSATSPQLHFELRRGSNPVNPLDYLSGA